MCEETSRKAQTLELSPPQRLNGAHCAERLTKESAHAAFVPSELRSVRRSSIKPAQAHEGLRRG